MNMGIGRVVAKEAFDRKSDISACSRVTVEVVYIQVQGIWCIINLFVCFMTVHLFIFILYIFMDFAKVIKQG